MHTTWCDVHSYFVSFTFLGHKVSHQGESLGEEHMRSFTSSFCPHLLKQAMYTTATTACCMNTARITDSQPSWPVSADFSSSAWMRLRLLSTFTAERTLQQSPTSATCPIQVPHCPTYSCYRSVVMHCRRVRNAVASQSLPSRRTQIARLRGCHERLQKR